MTPKIKKNFTYFHSLSFYPYAAQSTIKLPWFDLLQNLTTFWQLNAFWIQCIPKDVVRKFKKFVNLQFVIVWVWCVVGLLGEK